MARKPREIVCQGCNQTFTSVQQNPKFCSTGCRSEFIRRCNTVKCHWCSKEFVSKPHLIKSSERLFCSRECCAQHRAVYYVGEKNHQWRRNVITCEGCGVEFTRKPSEHKNSSHKFCSSECYWKNWDVSNSHRKIQVSAVCDNCGTEMSVQPCKLSTRKHIYCSKACKDEHHGVLYSGENHPLWKTDKSNSERQQHKYTPRYQQWRKNVYERDGYQCVACGCSKSGSFVAHHMDSWDRHEDKRLDVTNGVTLCKQCHTDFHRKYGYGKNTKSQFDDWLESRKNESILCTS